MRPDAVRPAPVAAPGEWVLVVDLDDTLLVGNSFHLVVRWLLRPSTPVPAWTRTRLVLLTVGRAVRVVPRLRFKQAVHRVLSSPGTGGPPIPEFVDALRRQVRPDVLRLVEEAREEGVPTVLATAALAVYAVPFGRAMGFDHVVATAALRVAGRSEVLVEARGATKVAVTRAALERHGLAQRRRVLLADHDDDLPLARICNVCHWVRPGVPVSAAMPWSPGRAAAQTPAATLP